MKYLIIAVLASLVFILVYTRIRPYLKLIQKVVQSFNVVTDVTATTATREQSPATHKLVRCERCGTWVPADRALKLKSGLATFCSAECMSKPASKERKLVG